MMYSLDLVVFRYLNSWVGVSPFFDWAIRFRAIYLWYLVIAAVLLFVAIPFVFPRARSARARNLRLLRDAAVAAFVGRYVITELIRFSYSRPRPFEVLTDAHQIIAHTTGGSFPSGHAALSFAIAAAVSFYYPKTSIFFFLAAFSIGVSRVAAGIHWPSDIFGGAVVGIATSIAVQKLLSYHAAPPSPLSHGTDERSG